MAATQVRGATHVCSCSSSFIEIVVCLYRFSGAPATLPCIGSSAVYWQRRRVDARTSGTAGHVTRES